MGLLLAVAYDDGVDGIIDLAHLSRHLMTLPLVFLAVVTRCVSADKAHHLHHPLVPVLAAAEHHL